MDHSGHHAAPGGWELVEAGALVLVLVLALGYALALWAARTRSPWPAARALCWTAGLACAALALAGPLARAAHTSFTAHMLAHVLLGMLGPLLLVLGAPVTLALRALPVARARTLSRLLRSPWLRLVSHPLVAATLDVGGLWLLYTTGLYPLSHQLAWVHLLVHAHVLLAGYLFTAAVLAVDPQPHRVALWLRCAVLVAFMAAHSVLAKWLYAHPPAGVDTADAQRGAQLMYYAGDAVDVALVVLVLAGWYATTRPRPAAGAPVVTSGRH